MHLAVSGGVRDKSNCQVPNLLPQPLFLMDPETTEHHPTITTMTAMDTAFYKQVLLALAGSGQRPELEGVPTISEVEGEIVRLRKQMDALQREAREHGAYLDRLRGKFQKVDEMLPKPAVMMTPLAAEIKEAEIKEAEAEEAHFKKRLDELGIQKTNAEELVLLLSRLDELWSQKSTLEAAQQWHASIMYQRAR